jgi:hypothetical protein
LKDRIFSDYRVNYRVQRIQIISKNFKNKTKIPSDIVVGKLVHKYFSERTALRGLFCIKHGYVRLLDKLWKAKGSIS